MTSGIFANPVLVGAVTVLVTIVAVFLAYNANNGLPFVPTTTLKVQLTNGGNLGKGNEVRVGGYRAGVVQQIEPVDLPDGTVGAEATLKLDKSLGDIPRDSTAVVRSRSALGLKYLDLQEGDSSEGYRDGDTMHADNVEIPVDLDDVFEMFDEKTREAQQENLDGYGNALTSRGESLGRTFEELPRLMTHLEPVMRNLASEDTDLDNFFRALGRAARAVAPVSETQARLFTTMADTWEAFGRDEEALKAFISKSPPTMDVAIDSFKVQRPFLSDFAAFSHDFKGATRELRGALPVVNRALERGTPVLRRGVEMNDELARVMRQLRELAQAPGTGYALRALTATVDTLNPQLRFYGPYITVCNYPNIFFTTLAEHFTEEDQVGQAQRALANHTGRQDDSLGSMGANAPANGEGVQEGAAQFLQAQDYTAAVDENGNADCENGQRGFTHRNARYYPEKFKIARDPRTPGNQGPTFWGRPKVPEGQTFTHHAERGPYASAPPGEYDAP